MTEHGARTLSEQLGEDLRDAFTALAAAALAPEQHGTFQRRLLAITTTAKRDVARAHEQLERLQSDLRAATTAAARATDSAEDE